MKLPCAVLLLFVVINTTYCDETKETKLIHPYDDAKLHETKHTQGDKLDKSKSENAKDSTIHRSEHGSLEPDNIQVTSVDRNSDKSYDSDEPINSQRHSRKHRQHGKRRNHRMRKYHRRHWQNGMRKHHAKNWHNGRKRNLDEQRQHGRHGQENNHGQHRWSNVAPQGKHGSHGIHSGHGSNAGRRKTF